MAVTIDQIFAQQFGATLYALAQQKESKFASKVRRETVASAELAYFDSIGAEDPPEQATTRHGDTPLSEPNLGRRKVMPYKWHKGTILDEYDKARMMADPQGPIVQGHAMSFGRKKDDLIITAALGTAYVGKTGATTIAALNNETGQIGIDGDGTVTAAETLPAAGTPVVMTLGKILLMSQLFNEADVDPDIPKYWAVSPGCIKEMLDVTEITSADYVTVKALLNGKVDTFMGFNFFWTNRLTKDAATSTCWRTIAWAQDGLLLAYIGDIKSRMSERPDKCYSTQIYTEMDLGAVRMEGAKVRECLNKV
jgi:hypothetical protein